MVVDQSGTVYVTDSNNNSVMRWFKDSKSGSVIIGGRGGGSGINQLSDPNDLTFDRQKVRVKHLLLIEPLTLVSIFFLVSI